MADDDAAYLAMLSGGELNTLHPFVAVVAVWCVAPECATGMAEALDQPLEDSWDLVDGEISSVGSKDSAVEWEPIEDDSHEYWWD